MPSSRAWIGESSSVSVPSISSVPSSGCSAPDRHLTSVDLPAPLSPISATTSPAATSNETSSSAVTWPKSFVMSWAASAGRVATALIGSPRSSRGTRAAAPGGRQHHPQVRRQRGLGADHVVVGDVLEDRRVLVDQLADRRDLRQAQTASAVEVHLRALGHGPHAREAAVLDERLVEGLVEDVERVDVVRGMRVALAFEVRLEPLDVRRCRACRRPAKRRAFERFADELRLGDSVHADPRDERPGLRIDLDQALVRELQQRLAHRCPADAVPDRELLLRKWLPGLELERHDLFLRDRVDLRAHRRAA